MSSLDYLSDNFSGKYKLIHGNIGEKGVAIVTSSIVPPENLEVYPPAYYDKNASPIIIIEGKNNQRPTSVYEITISHEGDNFTGNTIKPEAIEFKDFDNDKIPELYTEWSLSFGGSDALKGVIVFKNDKDIIKPIQGFPGKGKSLVITDLVSRKVTTLPLISWSSYSKFEDINNDSMLEFLYATYDWKPEESHYEPHFWNLSVYELKQWQYEPSKWWNTGKPYKTTEKIGFGEQDKNRLISIFREKVYNSDTK